MKEWEVKVGSSSFFIKAKDQEEFREKLWELGEELGVEFEQGEIKFRFDPPLKWAGEKDLLVHEVTVRRTDGLYVIIDQDGDRINDDGLVYPPSKEDFAYIVENAT